MREREMEGKDERFTVSKFLDLQSESGLDQRSEVTDQYSGLQGQFPRSFALRVCALLTL